MNSARMTSPASIHLPGTALPRLPDYCKACARLICATFPATSQHAICDRAERETRLASSDTFDRIISGKTERIDGHLMQCVPTIAAARGVAIPAELAVRS